MTGTRLSLCAAAIVTIALAGCGVNLFSVSQDKQLGDDLDREIHANPQEYPILHNESVRGYLQSIVDDIIRSPQVQYDGTFPYKVTVINDDRTVNAFATPGGYIYVYTGLLRFCDNEAMVAGVLAHEIAHSEERHGTEHMTQSLGMGAVVSIIEGSNSGKLAEVAANSASLLATLANSRSDESEADERGFRYLQSTRWWPGGIALFCEKLVLEQGRGTSPFGDLLSTHPGPESRIEHIEQLMKENQTPPPTASNLFTSNYRNMLRTLR